MVSSYSFVVKSDDAQNGQPFFESTISAILLLGSCVEAEVSLSHTGIVVDVRGVFQSVQPLRRGRSNARGSDSSWWPEGFQWVLHADIADSDALSKLTKQPVLVVSCPCNESSGPCSSPAHAVDFMSKHSSHCPAWATQLARSQQLQMQLQQEMASVQQHQQEALALPIQRAASLVCLEAVYLLMNTPSLHNQPKLRQLAHAVLRHSVMWHVSSFYRPDPKRKPPSLRSPHLMWLVVGAPPYCNSAVMLPSSYRHRSLEACSLVCCLRSCNLLSHIDEDIGSPESQMAAAIQQLLLLLCDGGSSVKPEQRMQMQDRIMSMEFVEQLLQLRGLKLSHILSAAADTYGMQLPFCVVCGHATSSRPRDPLVSCKTCCHSYHVSCALVDANAEALYAMQAYPAARAGTCLGCQHFPFRATSATGGLPWALAAGKEEEDVLVAAPQHVALPASKRHSSSHLGTTAARQSAVADVHAAVPAEGQGAKLAAAAAETHDGEVDDLAAILAAIPAVADVDTPVAAEAVALAADDAKDTAGVSEWEASEMGAEPGSSSEDAADEDGAGTVSRSSSDAGDDAEAEAGAPEYTGSPSEAFDDAWDAAARITTAAAVPDGQPFVASIGRKAKAKKAAAEAAAAAGPGGASTTTSNKPPASGRHTGPPCEPIPGGTPPPAADVKSVKQYVLKQLQQRGMLPASITCRTFLKHGLLPPGLHVDFISKGRFKVVAAAQYPCPGHDEQRLQCTVPGCRHTFATWQAAEMHARPGASSRRHSTEEMQLTGTNVSVKGLLKLVQNNKGRSSAAPRQQQHRQSYQQYAQLESEYQQYQEQYEQYVQQQQQHEPQAYSQPQRRTRAGADEDDAAYALQLLSAAPAQQQQQQHVLSAAPLLPHRHGMGAAEHGGFAVRMPAALGNKRWLDGHEQHNDNSSDVSVTSTATAAERAGTEAKQPHKRQRTAQQLQRQLLQEPMQPPQPKKGDQDHMLLQDQEPMMMMQRGLQQGRQEQQHEEQQQHVKQQQQLLPKIIMMGLRVLQADPVIKPILLEVAQSGDVELLRQQLEFWMPDTLSLNEAGAATASGISSAATTAAAPNPRPWEYDALQQQGIPQMIVDVCKATAHAGDQQAVIMQLCMDTVAAVFMTQPAAAGQQLAPGGLLPKCRKLTEAMLQLALASLGGNSASYLNLSTIMLAAAAAAVVTEATAEQRLDQLLSICGCLQALAGSLGESLWGGFFELVRTKVVNDGVIVESGLCALQQLLVLVRVAPSAWQVALLIPYISIVQQQQQVQQGRSGVSSSSLLQALFASLHRSFQLKQQCAAYEAERQQRAGVKDQQQQEQHEDAVCVEVAARRVHAREVLLPAFAQAMAAATGWLASSSSSSSTQLCAVHELLVRHVVMVQQLLRALLLSDQQLHDVLEFVKQGFPEPLIDRAVKCLSDARSVFEQAAGKQGEDAARKVMQCKASMGGGVCPCEAHSIALDCKLVGELLATTITYVAAPAAPEQHM